MHTASGVLSLGGALIFAQIICCLFEVAHATIEEVPIIYVTSINYDDDLREERA